MYPESVLNRILFATRYTRHLNRFGYLRVQNWKFYGERGLLGEPVTVWIYDGRVTVEYQTVALSKYDIELTPDRKQITQVSNPRRAQHPFRSSQLTLIDVSDHEWRLYWLAPSYQSRRRQSYVPSIVQLPLFDTLPIDLDVSANGNTLDSGPHLHLGDEYLTSDEKDGYATPHSGSVFFRNHRVQQSPS